MLSTCIPDLLWAIYNGDMIYYIKVETVSYNVFWGVYHILYGVSKILFIALFTFVIRICSFYRNSSMLLDHHWLQRNRFDFLIIYTTFYIEEKKEKGSILKIMCRSSVYEPKCSYFGWDAHVSFKVVWLL